jgi:hypothetical protein
MGVNEMFLFYLMGGCAIGIGFGQEKAGPGIMMILLGMLLIGVTKL